jgi:hypothetical protein
LGGTGIADRSLKRETGEDEEVAAAALTRGKRGFADEVLRLISIKRLFRFRSLP